MSIDLDWAALDQVLAQNLIDLVNRQLTNTTRPSFIGPVEVISLEFGATPPHVEIVDVRDVYRDFAECDGQYDGDNGSSKDNSHPARAESSEDGFEWISRRTASGAPDLDGLTYHHLPPHMRYGRGPSTEFFGGISAGMTQGSRWQNGMVSLPDLRDVHLVPPSPLQVPRTPSSVDTGRSHTPNSAQEAEGPNPVADSQERHLEGHPDVQLHFRVEHQADLRLTLTTSMLINYPSPMFMALPIKLSVIGLIFTGEVVLAYEGSKKRFHLSILDDLDPYGPVGERAAKTPLALTPNDSTASLASRASKPPPIGLRLLPSIVIESEIGQADKHVLKNVTRVERFIQDVIRKTLEEELVFPNFHTILLPDSQ
jgi:distribution and morphology protein 12